MSTATYPDGRVVEFDESPDLVKYYEDDGATVTGTTAAVTFPRVFEANADGELVEQLPTIHDGDTFVEGAADDGSHGDVPDAIVQGVRFDTEGVLDTKGALDSLTAAGEHLADATSEPDETASATRRRR